VWRHKDVNPHILLHDGFVAFDSLQSKKVTYTRIVNLTVRPTTSWDTRKGEEFSERGPKFLNYV